MTVEKAEEVRKLLYRIEYLEDMKKRFSDPDINKIKMDLIDKILFRHQIVINPEEDIKVLILKDKDIEDILRYICDGLEIDINKCKHKLEEY